VKNDNSQIVRNIETSRTLLEEKERKLIVGIPEGFEDGS